LCAAATPAHLSHVAGSHIKYSKDDIEQLIVGALSYQREYTCSSWCVLQEHTRAFNCAGLPIPLRRMRSKNLLAFWSDLLLQHHPQAIQGAKVVVFGSTSPQYEVGLLARGAASVVTVEYNKLTYDHPQLSTMQVQEAEAQLQADSLLPTEQRSLLGRFDLALSVSSFDHDGLGRYGDPLNPDGDLLANDAVQQYLKPSGAYLFAVPVGPDAVVWNLQRRYGAVRLPLMLGGWAVVDVAGWNSSRLAQPAPVVRSYEPAWLLQPTSVPTAGAFASEVLPLSGLLSGAVLPPATADPMQRSRAKHAVPSKQPQQQTGSEEL